LKHLQAIKKIYLLYTGNIIQKILFYYFNRKSSFTEAALFIDTINNPPRFRLKALLFLCKTNKIIFRVRKGAEYH